MTVAELVVDAAVNIEVAIALVLVEKVKVPVRVVVVNAVVERLVAPRSSEAILLPRVNQIVHTVGPGVTVLTP